MGAAGALDQVGIAQRDGAEDDAADAAVEPAGDPGLVPYTAAELDRERRRRDDRFHGGGVPRLAGEGAVEIDDMQPFETGGGEGARLIGRILVEDGRGIHRTAHQPHAGAALEVDGGKEDHALSSSGPASAPPLASSSAIRRLK